MTPAPGGANNERVPFGFLAREWERTCAECGCTWRVPRKIARRGIRGMSGLSVHGQTLSARSSNAALGSLRSGIGARAELMEGYQICAKCGVDDFTQRPVPRR